MFNSRNLILVAVLALIGGAIFYLDTFQKVKPEGNTAIEIIGSKVDTLSAQERISKKEGLYGRAKEITTPDGFINAEKIAISDLTGKKVVLLDIWTYSCINCQRTIPYINAWYEKYQDKGLEIIGLHTPEFEFEKNYENVKKAVEKFGIKYPVVLDNDYSTWQAYRNQYWPRKYLIDIDGFVVYDHIGEGGYAETEKKIQEALAERMAVLGENGSSASALKETATVKDPSSLSIDSPEVYFGAWRNDLLGNGKSGDIGIQSLFLPPEIKLNNLYLDGDWKFEREYIENKSSGAKIVFRYRAKDVYFVASAESAVKIKVLRDGKELGEARGEDIAADGKVTIKEDRLYKLIQDLVGAGEHRLEMIIESPGMRAFTFTFG